MILFISMTSFDDYQKLNLMGPKLMLESCAGEKCLLVHFTQITREEIDDLAPTAIVYSGGTVPHEKNHGVLQNEELKAIMQEWPGAQLAICYSAQLAVLYAGGTLCPIGPLEPGEPDPNPHYLPGMKKEFGVYPVEITRQAVLFDGLDGTIMVSQEHAMRIETLPDGYLPLAHSAWCDVQAYQAIGRPFFGVQFHPEKHRIVQTYPAGEHILRNFFTYARSLHT